MTPIILDYEPPVAGDHPGPLPTDIVLDPAEVAVGRTELALNAGAIRVADPGPEWGDAAIQASLVEAQWGELPVSYRLPNRQVRIPLIIGASGSDGYVGARDSLRQKVGLLQREGGWIRRGIGRYADVVNASLTYPDRLGYLSVEGDVVLTLECLPDFYGDEVDLGLESASGDVELTWETIGIEGDYPGRLRLVVYNDGVADWLGVIAALRSRHYSSAATAALAYEADLMTAETTAAIAAIAGASFDNAMRHNALTTDWLAVLNTDIATDRMTHTGSYRVWARVHTTSTTDVSLRFAWSLGDLAYPQYNDPATIDGDLATGWYLVDLGEVRLNALILGTHFWQGRIEALGASGGENVSIDKLFLFPLDEGFVKLRSESAAAAVVAADLSAQITTQGNYREFLSGAFAPVPLTIGDLLRIPPSGLENRVVQFIVKPSRGDLVDVADSAIDPVTAQAYYRPCWLFPE